MQEAGGSNPPESMYFLFGEMMAVLQKIKIFFSAPSRSYFFLGGIWGIAAIPCLCPACLIGPVAVVGRGALEHVPFLKKIIG